jgi:hypothetical protein
LADLSRPTAFARGEHLAPGLHVTVIKHVAAGVELRDGLNT